MIQEGEPLTTDLSLGAELRLYYDVYAPGGEAAPLLVALHGYGSNKGWMLREARWHAPEGFAVAALQGPHQHIKEPYEQGGPLRYGFGWLTNFRPEESVALHHKAVLDLVETLVARGVARPASVFLMGFSQSCALNYRFAFTHREQLRGVVGICGGLPGDWDSSELYKQTNAAVLHLTGNRDEFYPPTRTKDYAAQLERRARDVEMRSYDAEHEIVPAMREDVREWLDEHAAS